MKGNTEGARINRIACAPSYNVSVGACCRIPKRNFPITQSENSRINGLANTCGTLLNGGGVTTERAKELLSLKRKPTSEGVRINELIQKTIACSDDTVLKVPIVIPQCPPLPPPPAPSARACPLTKNMKIGS